MKDPRRAAAPLKDHMPLTVRGSTPRIFRSLGLFAEVGLPFCGGYLLAEAMISP